MVTQYSTATEYTANELTILRGTSADIVSVWVYHDVDPNVVPTPDDFTEVTLVDSGPLQEGSKIDVLSLIGPGDVGLSVPAGDLTLTGPADYQRFVMVVSATEIIIRSVDVLEVL
jgi:hypothetical protein